MENGSEEKLWSGVLVVEADDLPGLRQRDAVSVHIFHKETSKRGSQNFDWSSSSSIARFTRFPKWCLTKGPFKQLTPYVKDSHVVKLTPSEEPMKFASLMECLKKVGKNSYCGFLRSEDERLRPLCLMVTSDGLMGFCVDFPVAGNDDVDMQMDTMKLYRVFEQALAENYKCGVKLNALPNMEVPDSGTVKSEERNSKDNKEPGREVAVKALKGVQQSVSSKNKPSGECPFQLPVSANSELKVVNEDLLLQNHLATTSSCLEYLADPPPDHLQETFVPALYMETSAEATNCLESDLEVTNQDKASQKVKSEFEVTDNSENDIVSTIDLESLLFEEAVALEIMESCDLDEVDVGTGIGFTDQELGLFEHNFDQGSGLLCNSEQVKNKEELLPLLDHNYTKDTEEYIDHITRTEKTEPNIIIIDLFEARIDCLLDIPGVDEDAAVNILNTRVEADTLEKFCEARGGLDVVRDIQFDVGLLARHELVLHYNGSEINFNYVKHLKCSETEKITEVLPGEIKDLGSRSPSPKVNLVSVDSSSSILISLSTFGELQSSPSKKVKSSDCRNNNNQLDSGNHSDDKVTDCEFSLVQKQTEQLNTSTELDVEKSPTKKVVLDLASRKSRKRKINKPIATNVPVKKTSNASNLLDRKLFLRSYIHVESININELKEHLITLDHLSNKNVVTLEEACNNSLNYTKPVAASSSCNFLLPIMNVEHETRLAVREFECNLCRKKFDSHQERHEHYLGDQCTLSVNRLEEKTFECNVCEKIFGDWHKRHKHYLNIHTSENYL